MKSTWKMSWALSCGLSLLVVTQAMGQVAPPRNAGQASQRASGQQKICLASKVTKMMVKDKANQPIGQIHDLVIDESGQVKYLAIAAHDQAAQSGNDATDRQQPRTTPNAGTAPGGTENRNAAAGSNAKLTLVPYDAVQFHEGENAAQNYASLNIDKDRISQAPSFTAQQLSTQGQQTQWMSQVDQFFERDTSGAARPDLNNQNRNNSNNQNRNEKNNNQQERNNQNNQQERNE